uniref:Hydrogenase maturation factor HypB n=1 Tax=Cupriavidus necator TaxID=106590 RepID=O07450_CUPNE|nr:HypB2 [Cupriavidus necator H16]
MCTNCGCAPANRIEGQELEHVDEHAHADGTVHGHTPHHHGEHDHDHACLPCRDTRTDHLHYGHGPAGAHAPGMSQARMVKIEQDILGKNNAYARRTGRWFDEHGVFALNFVSSPGSGKTTLLVRTIEALKSTSRLAVIEGDQQTSFDAERIRHRVQALQINTGKGCHLDAHMVGRAGETAAGGESVLLIENVGNLVCPSAFDLGERHKVVILSVTEGDKPLKYPDMFRAASLMLLNKCDLVPHLSFDVERAIEYAKRVNPDLHVIRTSSATGEGFDAWLTWIADGLAGQAARRSQSMELLRTRIAGLEAQLAALKV